MKTLPLALVALVALVATTSGPAFAEDDPGHFEGPMHEKHAGQVVFAHTPIPIDAATDTNLVTTYALGDALYVRFWGGESANHANPKCEKTARLAWAATINGGARLGLGVSALTDDARHGPMAMTYTGDSKVPVTVETALSALTESGPERIAAWNGVLVPHLTVGVNKVHVEVSVDCGYRRDDDPVVGRGDLEITVKPGGLDAYATKFGPFLPKPRHPESGAIGPKFAELVSHLWSNEDVMGPAVLTSPGWFVAHDERNGAVVSRSSDAWLVVHLKTEPLPTACRAFSLNVKQAAMDATHFSPDVELGGTGTAVPVPCAVAKLPGR